MIGKSTILKNENNKDLNGQFITSYIETNIQFQWDRNLELPPSWLDKTF